MILIEENFQNVQSEVLEEGSSDGAKKTKVYLSGPLMEAETRNRNNRIYRLNEMTVEVAKIMEQVNSGFTVLGELDHPHNLDISLKNVSHKIVDLKMVGNKAVGKVEILEHHPNGQILRGLIKDGVKVGFSSRAGGKVDGNGFVSNFNLKTIDAVATPSARSAYPETLEEQVAMYRRGEIINDLANAAIHDPVAEYYLRKELRTYISSIMK